jgi:hypothetical protein
MVHTTVHLKEDQFKYLTERAAATQRSVEDLLSEMLEADIAWRQALASDPVAQLFGSVSDQSDIQDHIDEIVYQLDDIPYNPTEDANNSH